MIENMEKQKSKAQTFQITWAIAGLCIVIVVLSVILLISNNRRALQQDFLQYRRQWEATLLQRKPLTANDVVSIQPWMTFDYINTAFKLPPDVLKNTLPISDPRYPREVLQSYARRHSIAVPALLNTVRAAVQDYLLNKK